MLRRSGIVLVGRRDGRAAVHWPHFWLLQGLLLAVQSTGVVAVALLVPPPARTAILGLMGAVIALNAFLVAKRTREMLATPLEQLPDLDATTGG